MERNFDSDYKKIRRTTLKYIPIMFLAYLSLNILGLVLPLTMKKIYSSVILSKSTSSLKAMLFLAFIALLIEAILKKTKDTTGRWISSKYEYQLSEYLIKRFLSTRDPSGNSEFYTTNLDRFNNISEITNFYSMSLYQLLIDLPFMLIFFYLVYVFGGVLVYIPIVISVLYVLSIVFISKPYFKHRRIDISNNDLLIQQLTSTLEKIHVVKAAGIEESQINNYEEILRDSTESNYLSNHYKSIPQILTSNISQLNLFLILISGGYLMNTSAISFAEITACAMLGSRALSPVIDMVNQYLKWSDVVMLEDRINVIANSKLQYPNNTPAFPKDIKGTIELIDLEYLSTQTGELEGINFKISAGNFVAINPNDMPSYNEVLDRIIGKKSVTKGHILIDNLDINHWNMNSLKGKIEYITDHVSIYKGTVLENLTYFDTSMIQNAYVAASLTGLDKLVSEMPEGFETKLDVAALNYLSTSFLQRLNITRALVERPRILILDRISDSMDSKTYDIFLWLLKQLKNSMTIIIVTTDNTLLNLSDNDFVNARRWSNEQ